MKGRTKGRVSWAAARGAETPMEKSAMWVLVTQVSTYQRISPSIVLNLGTRPQNFTSPILGWKTFKGYRFLLRTNLLAGPARPPSCLYSTQLFCCRHMQQWSSVEADERQDGAWAIATQCLTKQSVMNRQLKTVSSGIWRRATRSPICWWKIFLHNLSRRLEELRYFWSKRREVCIIAYENMNTVHWTIFKQHLSKKWVITPRV